MKPVAIITGASSGLGAALAIALADRGVRVALLARRAQQLDALARDIASAGGVALAIPTDVSDIGSVNDAFIEVREEWGQLDVLFNNAGIIQPIAPLHELPDEGLQRLLNINIFGAFAVARAALRIMREQPSGGTIVNITSGASYKPYPGWTAYGGSKAAMDIMTRIAAVENADRPIRIFAIAPGSFESYMQETIRNTPEERFPMLQQFIEKYESGVLADAADVAMVLSGVALSNWSELNGHVLDIRDVAFQKECQQRGIVIPGSIAVV